MAEASGLPWRLLPSVRRHERERFRLFFFLALLLSLAQTVGIAASEALFLTRVGPGALPVIFVAASAITVIGCIGYAQIVGRLRNDLLYVLLLGGFGALILGIGILIRLDAPGMIQALFCSAYLTQAVLINLHFYTFASDFFDTLESKRLFPFLAMGASIGGVLGGVSAALVSREGSAEALLVVWAAALFGSAAMVGVHQRSLLRWRVVGGSELDESSVAGIGGALRYLTRSSLALWLAVSVAGMILSLFLIQFLYMRIFSQSFHSAASLAAFLGIYLALSNGIEIVLGTTFTPWLLRRFGIARANLLHPITTILTFAALAIDPRLYIAVLARANRELLENSVVAPLRQLTYNSLPFRFRGRVRALLEGVVQFGAMAMAGGALILLGGDVATRWLCLIGGGTALLYLGASMMVRREYLRSLVEELRRGRLDLDDLGQGIGATTLASLAEQWEETLLQDPEYPAPALLQLAQPLARAGFGELLLRAAHHPHPRVRSSCIDALSASPCRGFEELVLGALDDDDASVRLAAARASAHLDDPDGRLRAGITAHLDDPVPAVQAEAAARLGSEGLDVLRELARSPRPDAAVEALQRLPLELRELARRRFDDPDPQVRAASITAAARLTDDEPLLLDVLLVAISDSDAGVREAAARSLAGRRDPQVASALATALDDSARPVRAAASDTLATLGDSGVRAALTCLGSSRIWTVDAALRAIGASGLEDIHAILTPIYRNFVSAAWQHRASMELCLRDSSVRSRFLHQVLENAHIHCVWTAFRVLGFLEDPAVVRSVRTALRSGPYRERADALEVLSNLAERETSGLFALLLETGSFDDKLGATGYFVFPPRSFEDVLRNARESEDRWLRRAARAFPDSTNPQQERRDSPGESDLTEPEKEERDMERLLALRNVPIFAKLSLDRLEAIQQLMGEAEYMSGEAIVREGDSGRELFVLLEGEVETYLSYGSSNQRLLNTLTPVGYFGEIAVLDDAPRSATVVASKDSRLLTLAGEPFKELVLQTPEISFEIFRVLIKRMRSAEMTARES